MKRLFSFILAMITTSAVLCYADINTDRTMAKIARDTKTYISADSRASTEQEAYDQALARLTELVAEYLKKTDNNLPDAIYLPQLSGIYDRITNQIDNNRYRVMLYVKKSDIKPVSNTSGAIVLSKTDDHAYAVLPTNPIESTEPIVVTDTVIKVIEKPLDPTLSIIASKRTKDDLTSAIQSLGKSGAIEGAAKFPINKIDDFYVAVIEKNSNITALLHCVNGNWELVPSGEKPNLEDYSDCTAYWFTLTYNK